MTEQDWRSRHPAAEAVETIAGRLDRVRKLVDEQSYRDARAELHGRRWVAGVDLEGVPAEVIAEAEEWIQIGHDALRQMPVEGDSALRALMMARRAISG